MISAGNFVIENPLRPVIDMRISSVDGKEERTVRALVDTGAMRSFVSSDIAKEMGLKNDRVVLLSGATSKTAKKIRLCKLNLHFPFDFTFRNVSVGKMSGIIGREYDFVIGMDIISCGDLLMTNADGKMILSLRFPPDSERIMFERY